MHYLYFVESLDGFNGVTAWHLERFEASHSKSDQVRILAALQWAKSNPNYEFESLLPRIRFSRQEIHKFLVIVCGQLTARLDCGS